MTAKHDYSAALESAKQLDNLIASEATCMNILNACDSFYATHAEAIRASLRQSVELERKAIVYTTGGDYVKPCPEKITVTLTGGGGKLAATGGGKGVKNDVL